MELYKTIDSIGNKQVLQYIIIIIIGIIIFRSKNIGINIVVGMIFALVVICYLYDKNKIVIETEKREYQDKIDYIKPAITVDVEKNVDDKKLVDLLFSIQDLYIYNPQAYEEMIDNIQDFLKLETILGNVQNRYFQKDYQYEKYFQLAQDKKNNAINSLHSIIFQLPSNHEITDKLERAYERLETVLTDRLNHMYDKCYELLIRDGYTVHNTVINIGPTPANNYSDTDFTLAGVKTDGFSYQVY